jgi:hypothetical protein
VFKTVPSADSGAGREPPVRVACDFHAEEAAISPLGSWRNASACQSRSCQPRGGAGLPLGSRPKLVGAAPVAKVEPDQACCRESGSQGACLPGGAEFHQAVEQGCHAGGMVQGSGGPGCLLAAVGRLQAGEQACHAGVRHGRRDRGPGAQQRGPLSLRLAGCLAAWPRRPDR